MVIPIWSEIVVCIVIVLMVVLVAYGIIKCIQKAMKNSQHDDDMDRRNKEENPLLSDSDMSDVMSRLNEIFYYGKALQLHTAKGPKRVTMYIANSELRWESIVVGGTKKYKLDLKDLLQIEKGKKTKNLLHCNADEKKCLSLVSSLGTLDVEAASEYERELLSQAFIDFITNNQLHNTIQHL